IEAHISVRHVAFECLRTSWQVWARTIPSSGQAHFHGTSFHLLLRISHGRDALLGMRIRKGAGSPRTFTLSLPALRVSGKRSDNKYTFRVQAADISMPRSQRPRKRTAS